MKRAPGRRPGAGPIPPLRSIGLNNPNGVTRPPFSIGIIVVCAILFLSGIMPPMMALWPLESGHFGPWQLVTYALLHGGFNHVFFNMFAVWMFGLPIERAWGTRRFVLYFTVCVIGAAVTQLVVQQASGSVYPTIGASGAVFGLLLAYGVTWPNNRILLILLPVPIKAKWFVLIYGTVELLFGVTGSLQQIAHFAHLGGLLFGAGMLWRWGWRPSMTWRR
jgi:membrane associated rhomboid family serine protease